jgi:CHAD domain-containing protein
MACLTTSEVAMRVLRQQGDALQERASGIRAGQEAEHVHRTRVATRRLRAALGFFRDVLPPDTDSVSSDLRWLAERLGAVRDLDVQMLHVRRRGEALSMLDDLGPYAAWLAARRQRARSALLEALDAERYASLLRDLECLTGREPSTDGADVLVDAPPRLRKVWKRLRKAADSIGADSADGDLHRARIRAKRVRYAVEFHVDVFGETAREFANRVTRLQDALGEHQDGVVCRGLVDEARQSAAESWSPAASFALGRLVQADTARAQELRAEAACEWNRLQGKDWKAFRRALNRSGS